VFKPNDEEIIYLREVTGFPQGEVVRPEPPPALAPFAGGNPNEKGDKPPEKGEARESAKGEDKQDKEGDEKEGKGQGTTKQDNFVEPRPEQSTPPARPLSEAEKRVDFAGIQRLMDVAEHEMVKDMAKVVKQATYGWVDTITKKRIIAGKKVEQVNDIEWGNKAQFRTVVKVALGEMYKRGLASAKQELGEPVTMADVGGLTPGEAKSLLDEIATFAADSVWDRLSVKTTPILLDAIQNGRPLGEVMQALDEALKGYDLALGAPELATIARTNISRVFNEGRAQWFTKAEETGEIQGYKISAVIDNKTSDLCLELDEMEFPPEELRNWLPPLHWGCRTVLVAIPKGIEFEADKMPAVKRLPGGFMELIA
jgi:SPP1 gp7 family putative phage head morphogenesis protein